MEAGVAVHMGVLPESAEDGRLWLAEGGSLEADLVVALPQSAGLGIAGLPADPHGFLPVDRYGRVEGAARIWAAGDATARPLKHGGLAAQQAEVAARSIAAELGGQVVAVPYEPALRGVLLTGDAPRFLRRSGLSVCRARPVRGRCGRRRASRRRSCGALPRRPRLLPGPRHRLIAGFPRRLGGGIPMARRRAAPTFASSLETTVQEPRHGRPPAPAPETKPAPEFPLLMIFAGLIVVAMVPICLVIAAPSTVTLVAALAVVAGFAIAVTALLARLIGPGA